MSDMYPQLTSRNSPIISPEIQKKIAKTRILVAGCGLGSLISESLARMGFQNFSLVDQDTIEVHNLNRQAYQHRHVGKDKVHSLKEVIVGINPEAQVHAHAEFINEQNVDDFVRNCDVIIDTIDFLDLKSVIMLHDRANQFKKPIFSVFAAAWGAVGVYIPPLENKKAYLRELFSVHEDNLDAISYTEKFTSFFTVLGPHLNAQVMDIMTTVLAKMQDNKPCPASVVITGAQCASMLCEKLLFDHLNGTLGSKPDFFYIDLGKVMEESKLKLNI